MVQDDRLMSLLFRQLACTALACARLHKADRSNPGSSMPLISSYCTPSFLQALGANAGIQ